MSGRPTDAIPRNQPLLDERGYPTLAWMRFWEQTSYSANRTFTARVVPVPEDYGAVGDGVTDDTAAMQLFFANSQGIGQFTGGATYLVSSDSLSLPANSHWWGPKSATIKNADAAGDTVTIENDDVVLTGITIDGGNSSATIASGLLADHHGVHVVGTSANPISNVRLERLTVSNVGYSAIEAYYAADSVIADCTVSRCGVAGILLWSPSNCIIDGCRASNIYPGETPGTAESNTYGIAVSNFGGDDAPTNVWVTRNYVDDSTWEGMDEHNGQFIYFIGNTVTNCGAGIAIEHHTSGYPARRIVVHSNIISGYGESTTKEGGVYPSLGGILAKGGEGGEGSEYGEQLSICDNTITNTGDTRPGDGGGISMHNWRNFTINDNTLLGVYRNGIICWHSGSIEWNIYGTVIGNTVDGVVSTGGVQNGIYLSGRTYALAATNFCQGSGTGVSQAGAPTYVSTISGNMVV